jgi:hypothetical protein
VVIEDNPVPTATKDLLGIGQPVATRTGTLAPFLHFFEQLKHRMYCYIDNRKSCMRSLKTAVTSP